MRRPWDLPQIRALSAALFALVVAMLVLRTAHADAPGSASIGRGDAAFFKHDYAAAEASYNEALEKGGLTTREALQCYVQLGAARVALGHDREAKLAFRNAALLDPHFVLPRDTGRRTRVLADDVRKDAKSTGAYQLTVEAPESVAASQGFHVTATMSAAHAALVAKVRVTALEPSTDGYYEKVEASSTTVGFDIPGNVAVSDQVISLKVEAVDAHDNRLVVVTTRVKVVASSAATATAGDAGAAESSGEGGAPVATGTPVITTKTDGESEDSEGTGPWSVPHGSKQYAGARVQTPPTIDGVLDEPIWTTAPKDSRFFSTKSKPYGQATLEPTVVQIAYDDENLYVAFRCGYSKPGPKDETFATDEVTLITESESVSVLVDPTHGHTGAFQFVVSPVGARGDVELSEQGSVTNEDWHGIWESGTHRTADGWTAELKIPFGTMRMPSHNEPFDLGVNFARREPTSGEYSLWSLHPPATEFFDTNYFGHLEGLSNVHPGQRLYLEPYVAMAFDQTVLPTQSSLNDFSGTNSNLRLYAGAYARFRPPGPFRLDATFNPDFSAVNPDQAVANFDRFEIEFPEARPFFAEDTPRFQFGAPRYLFGDLGAQMYYSRRLGIDTNPASLLTQAVPILWGVKSVFHDGGTEAAVMNVETSPAHRTISLSDNSTIARVNETYEGQRLGAIFLNRAGDSGAYTAAGADAALAFYDRHLQVSGFYTASKSQGLDLSGAGEGTINWKSQDFYAMGTYLDIGKSFDAPLGFFPVTGVRAEQFAAGYTPVIRSDLIQQVFIDSQLSVAKDRDTDARVFDRGVISASAQTIQGAVVQVSVQPAIENVTTAFPIGNGRITVPVGDYKVLVTQIDILSAPRRTVVWGLGYLGGDLYNGQRRAPSATFGLNLGRFSTRIKYQMFILTYQELGESFTGHEIDASASYAYSPRAKTTLLVEANTVSARATAQLATTIQFWTASAVSIALRETSGSTVDTFAQDWSDNPDFSAIVSFALGVTPF